MSMPNRSRAAFLALLAGTALLAGCTGASTPTGNLTIALTDTASDELDAFEVDITAIALRKLDGSTVSVLSRTTRVDFTELESLSELITAAGLEAGFYRGLTMTLDFAGAEVWIKGQTTAATVLDKNGAALTGPVAVRVDFPAGIRPRVLVNRRHLFQLDLNLDAAVSVNAAGNSVTFCPLVVASFDPTNPKPVAATGILTAVDTNVILD